MKALIVFNSLNDIVFLKEDEEFSRRLFNAAVENQLIPAQSESQQCGIPVSKDVVMQLFSPLITSNRVMQGQFNNGYSSIECDNGILVVMTEYLGYTLIGVGQLPDGSELRIKRRLQIFLEFIKLLYGPSLLLLKQEANTNAERPVLLSKLMDMWDRCHSREQMFLVEAIERLLVNDTLSRVVMKLLQNSMGKMRNFTCGDDVPCHALFFLKGKLLGLYSCRNATELSKEDLLLLAILARTLYDTSQLEDSLEHPQDLQTCTCEESMSDQILEVSFGLEATESQISGVEDVTPDYQQHLLFLRPRPGTLSPHHLYTVKISSDFLLIIVSQLKKAALSISLYACINLLSGLISRPRENRCHHISESLEKNMNRITDFSRKSNLSAEEEKGFKVIVSKWEQLKRLQVLDFIKSQTGTLQSSLEVALNSMQEVLSDMFANLLLKSTSHPMLIDEPSFVKVLGDIRAKVLLKLNPYIEYLNVKAEQNLTITSYLNDYPGLLHFMYVDRATNCLLLSSLENHPDLTAQRVNVLKEKIWKIVEMIQEKVLEGHFEFSRKEDLFHFTYQLFFEDLTEGRQLEPQLLTLNGRYSFPSIIGRDFYRSVIKQNFPNIPSDGVQCFEIFCIHLSAYSSSLIRKQTWKLAMELWESCGSAQAAIDIL